jgi:hypothetical protein
VTLREQLLDLEEQFWKGGPDFYHENLTDESLMVFPEPVGVLRKERTIETVAAGPRWVEVTFDETRVARLTEDAVMLIYRVTGRRAGGKTYGALASSVYVRQDDVWRLAFHQQTPSAGA